MRAAAGLSGWLRQRGKQQGFGRQTARVLHILAALCGLAVWFGPVCPGVEAQTGHYTGWGGVVQSGTTLSSPFGMTVDSAEQYAYVGDIGNHRILRVKIADGTWTTPYAYNASTDPGCQQPVYPSVDSSLNVYFGCADTPAFYKATYNSGTQSWGAVTALFTTSSGTGSYGSHIDSNNNLWVAVKDGNSGQQAYLLKCTTGGSCTTYYTFPTASSLGVSNAVVPEALAEDSSGNFYITDVSGNDVVWKLSNTGTASSPVAGALTNIQSCPSLGVSYAGGCYGVAVDSSGDVYMGSNSPEIYKLTPNGSAYTASIIQTVPGLLYRAVGIAVNASGTTLYAADYTDNGQNLGNGVQGPNPATTNLVRFGTTPQTFGSVGMGVTSLTLSMNFTFDTAGTLGSISVVTQGIAGLDFANAGTGTCTVGTNYSAGATCTVNVTFTPTKVGLRFGAVVLNNSSGTPFATGYVYGTGTGPVLDFFPVSQTTLDSTATAAEGIVGDAAGNLYIAAGSAVYKETCTGSPCSYVRSTLFTGALGTNFNSLQYLAIDGAGNLYLGDGGNTRIIKETLAGGTYTPQVICTANASNGIYCGSNEVAVDVAGNVYYLSGNTSSVNKITFEPTPQSNNNNTYYSLPVSIAVNNNNPWGVAVDASGNVYYTTAASSSGQSLIKLTPAGAVYEPTTLDSTLGDPVGISVDGLGNIYVAQYLGTSSSIVKETYVSGTTYTKSTIISPINNPVGVWADTSGNVFATSQGSGSVMELAYASPPTLSFANTAVGSTSASQTLTIQNVGNAPLVFSVPSAGTNPSVSLGFSNSGGTCPLLTTSSSASSLAAGSICTDVLSFAPVATGSATGSLVMTENNLNASGSTASVTLTGTGTAATGSTAQTITFPQPTTPVAYPASAVTLGATASSGLSVYYTVTGPATVSGSTLTYTGVGTVSVTAYQNGNSTYAAATAVTNVIVVTAPTMSVGSTSTTLTATLAITTAGTTNATLGTAIQVLTQGATGLDFNYVSGGTCALSTAYTVGQTCTVAFTFTPTAPGMRMGAIELFTASGTAPIAVAYISGIGNGPQGTFTPGTISTVAGNGTACSSTTATCGDGGSATGANLHTPYTIALDGAGNLYIADQSDHRIRKVTAATGIITTVAGNGTACSGGTAACGDGSSATGANLYYPSGVAVDGAGNLYIADTNDNRIRKVSASTGIISTVAGSGVPCYPSTGTCGDGGSATVSAANLQDPTDVALDGAGNLYITDTMANRIRKVTAATGIITTLAGNGTACSSPTATCGDGGSATAAGAYLKEPYGVALDQAGNVYISDQYDHRIRKITVSTGIITTVAGSGTICSSPTATCGDGGLATASGANFYYPAGISVDAAGDLYIADLFDQRVRKVTAATGILSSVSGNGTVCSSSTAVCGDGSSASAANFDNPAAVVLDGAGDLYIVDRQSNRIRKVTAAANPVTFATTTNLGTTDTTDGAYTLTLNNIGNMSLSFPTPGTGSNPSIAAGFTIGGGSSCPQLTSSSGAGSLASGASCTDLISFAPVATGSISGSIVTTDNSLNGSSVLQSVSLSGTAVGVAVSTSNSRLVVSPSPAFTGSTATVTVTLKDASGNAITGATGVFSSTSTTVSFGAPSVSGNVIMATMTDSVAETAPITVTLSGGASGTLTGSEQFVTQTLTSITVTGYSANAILTEGSTVTVKAYDQFSNVFTGFTGTVVLTSSDTLATLPSSYTFQLSDAGVHTFAVTLNTRGVQWIRATSGSVTGSQTGIAVGDAVWVENGTGTLSKLNVSGTAVVTGVGTAGTSGLRGSAAMDHTGDVWSVNSGTSALYFATAMGAGTTSYTGGGLSAPVQVAVDGAGMVWVANSGNSTVSVFTSAGVSQSTAGGYGSSYVPGVAMSVPSALAIDRTGGVWVANKSGNTVTHIFGAAAPVVTPLATATANGTLGVKP